MKVKCCFAFAALVFICFTTTASASVIYTDMAAFNTAVSGTTTYDFNGIVPPDTHYIAENITVGNVAFTDNYAYNIPFVINATEAGYGTSFFSGQTTTPPLLEDGSPNPDFVPSYVTATLTGLNAIGFSYGSYCDSMVPFTVTLSTGETFNLFTPELNGFDAGFVGFTSDVPITSVIFAEQGYDMDITQFITGPAVSTAPVPEPATMLLLGSGLIGLTGIRKKFKK